LTAGNGDILAFDARMESQAIEKLIQFDPSHKSELTQRLKRIKDLQEPFINRHYIAPGMKSGASLKNALAGLVPDFDYDGEVANGWMASALYSNLQREEDMFKRLEGQEALRAYCHLDTLAMVRILEALEEAVA
ncbi:MAG: DUF2779 domain-containing protein, partial [Salibacteraceae bacterium]